MKCPHCDYEHGYTSDYSKEIQGEDGDFFELESHQVIREEESCQGRSKETRTVYACPSCRKMFIGE